MNVELAGGHQRRDLRCQVGADSRYLAQPIYPKLLKLDWIVANRPRRVSVGTYPEEVLFADFEHVCDFIKHPRDVAILHPDSSQLDRPRTYKATFRLCLLTVLSH